MANGELVVVVLVGLCLGYLVVSMLMRDGGGKPGASAGGNAQHGARGAQPVAPAWDVVLGVSPLASENEIRAAYRSLMSQYHPDKVSSLGPELRALAERKTKEIVAAYSAAQQTRGFGG